VLLRDDRRNYVVTGLFVLAMIAALLVWISVLSGFTGGADRYTTRFASVMGLSDGTQVLFEGYRVGIIDGIAPTGEGDFRVSMSVEPGWSIPADSVVRLASSGLLAAVVLNIERGEAAELLAPGDEIRSEPPSDVFASVGALADELSILVREEVGPLVASVGERAPEIMEKLDHFSTELDRAAGELAHIVSEESHGRIGRILQNLDESSDGLRSLVDGLSGSRERMDSVLAAVDGLVEQGAPDLEAALADLRVTLEALARRSDAITHHLEATTRNFNEFSDDIRRDPSLILRGRDAEAPAEEE
jgi:phospholipid/cholesterol/gamma-HCH transport system substrate-binding protein